MLTAMESDSTALEAEAARLRDAGALGRSPKLLALFDYLLVRTREGRPPKEAEVAMDVFERPADFDPGRDAVARVYAHKLRSRLASAYEAEPERSPRLTVPRGEYRLMLERAPPAAPEAEAAPPGPLVSDRRALLLAGGVGAAGLLAGWLAGRVTAPDAPPAVLRARRGPLWAPLLASRRPTVIALGDYYIFGESENGMEVSRLVREYTVNSKQELAEFLSAHPEKMDRYLDLDLRYLPIGAGAALRWLTPVLAVGRVADSPRVVMMSDLTPAMLKTSNVVYVGYLSGMGWLRDVALAPSRFRIGETFDDIHDTRSGARYASQGGRPDAGAVYRDYGYISAFPGPEGGRVVVVAGTRDVALMQAAEDAVRASSQIEAHRRADDADAWEALYEVEGMSRLNVGARLVTASALDTRKLWTGGGPPRLAAPAG